MGLGSERSLCMAQTELVLENTLSEQSVGAADLGPSGTAVQKGGRSLFPTGSTLLALALTLPAGLVGGMAVERHSLNWSPCEDYSGFVVNDRYELGLGRPIVNEAPDPGDVDATSWTWDARGETHPLAADIHLLPYLLSERAGRPGANNADIRSLFRSAPMKHTNCYGEISIAADHLSEGPNLDSGLDYDPARLGASFMVADGRNDGGVLSFYELRIDHGRIWSNAYLYRYDCASDGQYSSCKDSLLPRDSALLVAAQHLHGPLSIASAKPDVLQGTDVAAFLALPYGKVVGSAQPHPGGV